MKDYYDLYYLIKYKSYSEDILQNAIEKTFNRRNTDKQNINKVLKEIEKSDFIKNLWKRYSQKYQYTKNIEFEEIISYINKLGKIIYKN